mgnify:CR=1 FL=1|jgi:hypothetical protein
MSDDVCPVCEMVVCQLTHDAGNSFCSMCWEEAGLDNWRDYLIPQWLRDLWEGSQ